MAVKTIAALYVEPGGVYYDLPYVDTWDITRDARKYGGPLPVVAHPPCARWSVLAPLVYSLNPIPEKAPGNDGGCFRSALHAVNRYGGVLEHPVNSSAWVAHDLPKPLGSGWQKVGDGWMCEVWQSAYGHKASKATGLYYRGLTPPLPLDWRLVPGEYVCETSKKTNARPAIKKTERIKTPILFRDVLLSLAAHSVAP